MTHSSSTDIARHLSMLEETIASLYAAFSLALPEMKEFWRELVVQEKAHAEVVGELADLCNYNDVYFNEHKFNIEAIKTHIVYIKKRTSEVTSGGITPVRALSLAADIEKSLLEAEYYKIIQSDHSAMLNEMRQIQQQTERHQAMIRQHLDALKQTDRERDG